LNQELLKEKIDKIEMYPIATKRNTISTFRIYAFFVCPFVLEELKMWSFEA
jgi:hypothetical protein